MARVDNGRAEPRVRRMGSLDSNDGVFSLPSGGYRMTAGDESPAPDVEARELVTCFCKFLSVSKKSRELGSFEKELTNWLTAREGGEEPVYLRDPYLPNIEINAGAPLPKNSLLVGQLKKGYDNNQSTANSG